MFLHNFPFGSFYVADHDDKVLSLICIISIIMIMDISNQLAFWDSFSTEFLLVILTFFLFTVNPMHIDVPYKYVLPCLFYYRSHAY